MISVWYRNAEWKEVNLLHSVDGNAWTTAEMVPSTRTGYEAPPWWTAQFRSVSALLKLSNGVDLVFEGSKRQLRTIAQVHFTLWRNRETTQSKMEQYALSVYKKQG